MNNAVIMIVFMLSFTVIVSDYDDHYVSIFTIINKAVIWLWLLLSLNH